jgi:hypothetical protein
MPVSQMQMCPATDTHRYETEYCYLESSLRVATHVVRGCIISEQTHFANRPNRAWLHNSQCGAVSVSGEHAICMSVAD